MSKESQIIGDKKKLIITYMPIESLKFDELNPNKMTEAEQDSLVASIDYLDFDVPVNVQRHELDEATRKIKTRNKNMIADGEHRVIAMKRLGETQIPCILKDMTEKERIFLRQFHNNIRGTHDPILESDEFKRIVKMGAEAEFIKIRGISDLEFQKIIQAEQTAIPIDNTDVSIPSTVAHQCVVAGCDHGKEESEN